MRHFVGFELLETDPSKINLFVAADEVTAISSGWIGAKTKMKGTIVQLTDGTSFAVKGTCEEAVKKVAEASRLT